MFPFEFSVNTLKIINCILAYDITVWHMKSWRKQISTFFCWVWKLNIKSPSRKLINTWADSGAEEPRNSHMPNVRNVAISNWLSSFENPCSYFVSMGLDRSSVCVTLNQRHSEPLLNPVFERYQKITAGLNKNFDRVVCLVYVSVGMAWVQLQLLLKYLSY